MRAAACLWRPAIHLLSSSQGPAPPRLSRLLHHHFPGASSPSPAASSWSWQKSASSLIARSSSLHVPSRSYRSGSYRSGSAPTATTKRHLYVVLGKPLGFDIHKLDMDDDDDLDGDMRTLPESPAVRFAGTARWTQFAALGSSIVGMGAYPWPARKGVTAIYDTKTAELATSDLVPRVIYNYHDSPDRVLAVGKTLYVFESHSHNYHSCYGCEVHFPGGLHCLRADAAPEEDKLWKWQAFPNFPRFSWSYNDPHPELPFHASSITSYAVHPRGRTIFVSAGGALVDVGTFTYSTGSGKWKRRGYWELLFVGRRHYDAQLDAWVGFHCDCRTVDSTDGHQCAFRVTSAASASRQPPEWKVSKETLLWEDTSDWPSPEDRLVYMADRDEYCLVEDLLVEDMTTNVLRLSMFRVMYDEDGELATTAHRADRYYEVPGDGLSFDAAFWM